MSANHSSVPRQHVHCQHPPPTCGQRGNDGHQDQHGMIIVLLIMKKNNLMAEYINRFAVQTKQMKWMIGIYGRHINGRAESELICSILDLVIIYAANCSYVAV